MSLPSNMPNLNALPEDVIDEILRGGEFKINIDEVPQIAGTSPEIIWVNGCFDVMHVGHIDMLKYARSLGQKLIVGLDTDERVQSNKGPSRPINNLYFRVKFMESIRYVDQVVTFGSDDELKELIRTSNADTIVVGQEYENDTVIGKELFKHVIFFPKLYNLSTSKLVG